MTQITAAMVKDLREKTGAGMMDAKKALTEVDGDMEAAVDFLRKKGLAKAEKKSSRTAAEGLVSIATEGTRGVVIEVNAETDFVARNELFQTYVAKLTERVLENKDVAPETYADATTESGAQVKDELTDLIAKIGENMGFRRATALSVPEGVVSGYVHSAAAPNMGKIGVLVALESSGDKDALEALGKQIAMHVAAARPEALNVDGVDADSLARERSVLEDQAKASGKPADIIEKMMHGRIRKYYEQVVLLEQTYVIDGETKVSKVIENAQKDVGGDIKLVDYTRFELGEGVEKKEDDDFASEVAKMAG